MGHGVTLGDMWAVGCRSWMGAVVSVGEWHAEGGTYHGWVAYLLRGALDWSMDVGSVAHYSVLSENT